jgi:hypothetical protein
VAIDFLVRIDKKPWVIVMAEPITTSMATAIATLAFQEFVKSGAGEVAKKFTN